MWTKKQVLVTSDAEGTVRIVPMRYNASHQCGWRCFLGPFAANPSEIGEDTAPDFSGRSLFDALAMFRSTIEPAGGRLLHAMASRECWSDDKTYDRFCRRLTLGSSATELIDGFLPIGIEDSSTLAEQRECYERWQASLSPSPRQDSAAPSRARKALDDSNAAIRATGEAAILSRGDLARDRDGE